MSSSLAEQGIKTVPEASGLVYVPLVQQVGGRSGSVVLCALCACVCVLGEAGGRGRGAAAIALLLKDDSTPRL